MPPHYFLSYARANNGPLVRKFFADLSHTIRSALSLPRSQPVGFYEETQYRSGDTWSDGALQALQSSQAMVCLLSLPYFHSELGGKEWDVFEQRRSRYGEQPAPVILTVNWITSPGPKPLVVSNVLGLPDSIHQSQAITTMLKSGSLGEYAEFVKTLANKIIDTAADVDSVFLEPFPSMAEAENAFHLWDGSAITTVEVQNRRNEIHNSRDHPDPFRSGASIQGSVSNLQSPSDVLASSDALSANYSALAISTKKKLLNQIEDFCRNSSFDLKPSEDHNRSMEHIKWRLREHRRRRSKGRELPELIVVGFVDGMQKTVEDLSEKMNVPSGILAIPGPFDPTARRQFIGATSVIFEPLDRNELIEQMEHCAEIGRKIRLHQTTSKPDLARKRQVFLSYCSKDSSVANAVRRLLEAEDVGVSYMDELRTGVEWEPEIETWISKAQIFLALITPNYLGSPFCDAELEKFILDLEQPNAGKVPRKKQKVPMLALYDSPDIDNHELTSKCKNKYQLIQLSDGDFDSDVEKLVSQIKDLVSGTEE